MRQERQRRVADSLPDGPLTWLGVRASDGAPLLALPSFARAYGLMARLADPRIESVTLEDTSGLRVDQEVYDAESDDSWAKRTYDAIVARAAARSGGILPYRSGSHADVHRLVRSRAWLAMTPVDQLRFERKPWVESALEERGVRTLGWRPYQEARLELPVHPSSRRWVLRPASTSGGEGFKVVASRTEADEVASSNAALRISAYIGPHTALNMAAVLFHDGSLSKHPVSLQLVGDASLTDRPFGYAGNDFGAARRLSPRVLSRLDAMLSLVAEWLGAEGYVGAFGVDALLQADDVIFAEVNPRFQGSSRLSAEMDAHLGRSDVYLEHLAAILNLDPPIPTRLKDSVVCQLPWSQRIAHMLRADDEQTPSAPRASRIDLRAPAGTRFELGAVAMRHVYHHQVAPPLPVLDPASRVAVVIGKFPGHPRAPVPRIPLGLGVDVDSSLADRLRGFVAHRLEPGAHRGYERAVIGLSGGVDSSVVAALARQAIGSERLDAVIVDLGLPGHDEQTVHAREVAQAIDVETRVVDGSPLFRALVEAVPEEGPFSHVNAAKTAIQSIVFRVADAKGAAVLSCVDRSEELLGRQTEGFYGHLAPILALYKTEVANLARTLGLPASVLSRPPGCIEGWDDIDVFGVGYDVLDPILHLMEECGMSPERIAADHAIADLEWLRGVFKRTRHRYWRMTTRAAHVMRGDMSLVMASLSREALA